MFRFIHISYCKMTAVTDDHVDQMIDDIQSGVDRIQCLVPLTEDQMRRFTSTLAHNKTVMWIVFYDGRFSDETLTIFCDFLRSNQTIELLEIYCNGDVGDREIITLIDSLKENKTIESVTLDAAKIGKPGLDAITSLLSSRWIEFDLRNTPIGSAGVRAITEARLVHPTADGHVIFEGSDIGDEEIQIICDFCEVNNGATEIYLRGNKITDKGAIRLANMLKDDSEIIVIDLQNNRIGSEGVKALIEMLSFNSTIHQIFLDGNDIGEDGMSALRDLGDQFIDSDECIQIVRSRSSMVKSAGKVE